MSSLGWFGGSKEGIGRGELAESRLETPFFAAFMMACGIGLFVIHAVFQHQTVTIALAVSMLVFGITVVRVHYGIYILAVSMLLSPEIGAGTVGQHSERDVNLRYDDVLIVVIFLGVMVKTAFDKRLTLWRPSPITAGILAYYGVCIVSTLDALRINVPAWDPPVAAFVMLKMLQFYLIFFMVGVAIETKEQIRNQLVVFFAVAVIVSLYAIHSMETIERVSAPFESGGTEPNTLGGYLIIVICVAVGLYLHAPSWRWKAVFLGLCGISVVPLIETYSRASYISIVVALLALAILGRRLAVAGLVAVALLLSPVIVPQKAQERIMYTFQQGSGEAVTVAGRETNLTVDKSTYERIYVWEKVRYNLTIWPWFGGGVSWETVMDSQYARVLLETGLFGFAAFSFLLYRIFRTTRESYRWSRDWVLKGLALGVSAAFIGLLAHGLGTISFLIVRIMEPFWYLTAMTVVGRSIAIREHRHRVLEERHRAEAASVEAAGRPPAPAYS